MRPPSPRACPDLNYFGPSTELKAFTFCFVFFFEALNQPSSAAAWQSHATAYALAGIDKHFGFQIQLRSVNPPANWSICRRLQKQGTTLKRRWLRRTKSLAHVAVSGHACIQGWLCYIHIITLQAETIPAPPGRRSAIQSVWNCWQPVNCFEVKCGFFHDDTLFFFSSWIGARWTRKHAEIRNNPQLGLLWCLMS